MGVFSKLFYTFLQVLDKADEVPTLRYKKEFTGMQMTEISNLMNRYDIKQKLNKKEEVEVTLTDGTKVKIKRAGL